MTINVLSLFGGIECGRVALDRLGVKIGQYYSSEIDPYAIQITKANYPDIIHVGSVTDVKYKKNLILKGGRLHYKLQSGDPVFLQTTIDLLIGGSPCQDLSIAKGNGKGLDGEKSGLFYEYVRILKEARPKYFLLENVASMKAKDKEKITEVLREIYPDTQVHLINSALVSAQNRKRLYWTNIQGITQPEDRKITLADIVEDIPITDESWKPLDEKYLTDETKLKLKEKAYAITATYTGACPRDYLERSQRQLVVGQFRRTSLRVHAEQDKSCTLTSNMGTGGNNVPILLGLAHRNRGEGKQPECNLTDKANSLTTVQSDSEILGIYQIPHGNNDGGLVQNGEKAPTITGSGRYESNNKLLAVQEMQFFWRKLTVRECERLQTLPDGYTDHVSATRRYKAIGNGWTVDVISHILSFANLS